MGTRVMKRVDTQRLVKGDSGGFFVLVCILVYVLVGRPQDLFLWLGAFRPVLVLSIPVMAGVLFQKNLLPVREYAGNSQVRWYLGLVLLMIVGIPFSYYPGGSFRFIFQTYLPAVLLFMAVLLTAKGYRQIETLLLVCCLGTGIYALFALAHGTYEEGRFTFGEMFDPNDIAFVMLSILMFNCLFLQREYAGWRRTLALINLVACLMLTLLTGSRGGLVGLGVMFLLFVFSSRTLVIRPLHKVLLLSVVALICMFGHQINFARYETLLDYSHDYNVTAETGRLAIWERGLTIMLNHPLTGVGANCFPEAVGRARAADGIAQAFWQEAHNSLIQIGTEIGVGGALLFAMLSLGALRIFRRGTGRTDNPQLARVAELARIGFAGHLVSSMFLSQGYSVLWVFYIALSAVLHRLQTNPQEAAEKARSTRRFKTGRSRRQLRPHTT